MAATSSDPVDILPALRTATEAPHRQLEDAIGIESRLADPKLYQQLVEIFYGFHQPLESRLSEVPGWEKYGLDFRARCKTVWLQEDLRALGLNTAQIEALPTCGQLPPADSLAKGFGCMYVLEGATLGGRHITALAKDSPVPATARNYFNSYGADTAGRWREFVGALEKCAADSGDEERGDLLHAARETFRCLHAWFTKELEAQDAAG